MKTCAFVPTATNRIDGTFADGTSRPMGWVIAIFGVGSFLSAPALVASDPKSAGLP
ncbi:hypothetical protein [Rhodoplanes sp. SY1]|uniref:hypothetical protein n=1 Tax=Rhodoplanes sp. SY1 TaxID=3166646 RepID=UPI0038B4ABC0